MTTDTQTLPPLVEFTRQPIDTPYGYEYVATTDAGVFMVRREDTTHAYPRGAGNPRWFIYLGTGTAGVRQGTGHRTLAEAQQAVRRQYAAIWRLQGDLDGLTRRPWRA